MPALSIDHHLQNRPRMSVKSIDNARVIRENLALKNIWLHRV